MTPKMKEYKKAITANSCNEDDKEEVEFIKVNDDNADSGKAGRTGVIVPNMLPIPGAFLVVKKTNLI